MAITIQIRFENERYYLSCWEVTMKLITCAGYYRTGSSAISDFFSEFSNCTSFGDFEFRFIQDPGGISDLEYNLVENNHRHNTSHAIKKFIKLVNFLDGNFYSPRYRIFFDDKFYEYSMEYVDNITQLQCNAWWHMDRIDRGGLFYFIDRVYGKLMGFLQKGRANTSMLSFREPAYFTHISKGEFYAYTREYINKLFSYANKNKSEFLMVDQLVPPSNINRYLNYFDDLKVICVERDPRDLYVLEKTKYRWGIMPYKDVETFCKWYIITREHRKREIDNKEKILRINFEDLIYQYDKTANKLIDFVGIGAENHTDKKTVFIPEKSVQNTKVFVNCPELVKEIQYIEFTLKEFLYDYPND